MPVESICSDTCIGCGTCVSRCPLDVLRLDTLASEQEQHSPCSLDCPLGVNQRRYHNLIELDMLDEAVALIREAHPMPAITGRVCPHPCETNCSRGKVDEPININGLEQYLGDMLLKLQPVVAQSNGDRVAVIGSGPAGLAAAYHLNQKGYAVTVYEKENKPGGMLRTAVPNFRLPEEIIDRQIALYEQMGIEFKTGVQVGKGLPLNEIESQGYKAVIAATGASKPFALQVPGADAEGMTSAMDFLHRVKTGAQSSISGSVVIVGGGSVALDAARTAIRLGADEVNLLCLEKIEPGTKDSMLALTEEIEDALAEGIKFHPSRSVSSFTTAAGKVTGVKCVECLSVRDDQGMFKPEFGETILADEIKADSVIMAIGQAADPELVPEGFATTPRGLIITDSTTKQVGAHLFAIGDAVTGPTTVVACLGEGKKAAVTVDRFIKGEEMATGLNAERKPFDTAALTDEVIGEISKASRVERRRVPVADRQGNFNDTLCGFSWDEASQEAERCLTCGSKATINFVADCQICNLCGHYCPVDAITVTDEKTFPPMLGWG
jgi:NADPH-dependent glutamate synthase beta subunit-like oxidoreductase